MAHLLRGQVLDLLSLGKVEGDVRDAVTLHSPLTQGKALRKQHKDKPHQHSLMQSALQQPRRSSRTYCQVEEE